MSQLLTTFFRGVYGRAIGWVCIAAIPADMKGIQHRYFRWPSDETQMINHINNVSGTENVYFCPQILEQPHLKKENVSYAPSAWADLDTCQPSYLHVAPSFVLETSPNRFQALWVMEDILDPHEAEELSKRIAYKHAPQGADRSGWDLSQLLRVPGTRNFKYPDSPQVTIVESGGGKFRPRDFYEYPELKNSGLLSLPLPEKEAMPVMDREDLMQHYRRHLNPMVFTLYMDEPPEGSWSERLWKLEMLLFEAGMNREEVFYVCQMAACNKYKRDNRPESHLWRDVCRAFLRHEENINTVVTSSEQADLLSDEELASVANVETFVERYSKWASGLGDAASQYHPAGAFIILSSLLGGRVQLPTSFGVVGLNLWFMILADTTLTRKSTAMDIGIDLLGLVDQDSILATDGSIEGLMTGLQGRSRRPSVFLRDEFSGLIEQMTKKDYYAGMMETLTKLYDGKMQKRILRKETLTIINPVLIIFAGGIKSKVQSLLTYEHISSGFVPRFIFITAESSTARMQPLGPPSARDYAGRDELVSEMEELIAHYVVPGEAQKVPGGFAQPQNKVWDAELTPEAWARYNKFEQDMMQAGLDSERPELMTPLYDRLAKSTLKAATLLSASRQRGTGVTVEESDIVLAIKYCRDWRNYANDVVNGVGQTSHEREIQKIFNAIASNPGISRSRLMQNYHLTARQADAIFGTLEQRSMITPNRVGKGTVYYAAVDI